MTPQELEAKVKDLQEKLTVADKAASKLRADLAAHQGMLNEQLQLNLNLRSQLYTNMDTLKEMSSQLSARNASLKKAEDELAKSKKPNAA